MDVFLTFVTMWLSANFGLDVTQEHPRIEFLPTESISKTWYEKSSVELLGDRVETTNAPSRQELGEVQAFYDDRSQTIYLSEGWSASSIADLSLLAHEMVHHLQQNADLKYQCAEAREKLAYRAQARWLEMYGRSLESEFGLDPMTILVRTNCMH